MPKQGLTKWFSEKWVDLSRPIYNDAGKVVGFEPCGRKKATEQRATKDYPKCRPLKAAMVMSDAERKRAVRRKRKAEESAPFKGRTARAPVMVRTNPWGGGPDAHFDASYLLEAGEPTYEYFDPDSDIEDYSEEQLYDGRVVSWIGNPGVMMRIPADRVIPVLDNMFYPDQIATYYDYIKRNYAPPLHAPAARIHFVSDTLVEESQQADDEGLLHEMGLTRLWSERDIGEPYAVLIDGNHRAFAAILAGAPYIWVYVSANYRKDAEEYLE